MKVGFVIVRVGGYVWYWVRYGRAKLISVKLISNTVLVRTTHGTNLGIRRILLQVVLLTTSLSGGGHVWRGRLVMWSGGGSRVFGQGWTAG